MKRQLILMISILLLLTACSRQGGMNTASPAGEVFLAPSEAVTTDISVTVDGVPMETVEIGAETAIALEELSSCDFSPSGRFADELFDMEAGCSYEYAEKTVAERPDGEELGIAEPSKDIVRVNGIKISSYLFDGKHYARVSDLCAIDDEYNKEWGYSDYNMRLVDNGGEKRIECFRFPPIDYEKSLESAEAVSSAEEMELYTETGAKETVFYGGKYEPKTGVYAGIIGDGNGGAFEGDTPTFDHDFSVYSSYIEFDERQSDIYEVNKRAISGTDCVMLVPWNIKDITLVYEADYQDYIYDLLDRMKEYKRPVIIRFGAEMNIGGLGNSPSAYVKAFRYISDIIHRYGFAVMWSPNDMSALNKSYSYYYPGDKYVDWIGISSFMRKDFMNKAPTSYADAILFNSSDFAYHTNAVKRIVKFMEENNIKKPLAISEGGVISAANYDGAPEDYTVWAHERLGNMYWYLPMRCPQVKMITYFNHTSPGAAIGYRLKDKPDYITIIENALKNAPYLLSAGGKADFAFTEAAGRDYKEKEIPLYTYLYMPGEGGNTVGYYLDGTLLGEYTEIPYKMTLNTETIPDGGHKLTVSANNGMLVREYTLTKEKNKISIK